MSTAISLSLSLSLTLSRPLSLVHMSASLSLSLSHSLPPPMWPTSCPMFISRLAVWQILRKLNRASQEFQYRYYWWRSLQEDTQNLGLQSVRRNSYLNIAIYHMVYSYQVVNTVTTRIWYHLLISAKENGRVPPSRAPLQLGHDAPGERLARGVNSTRQLAPL